MRQYDPKKVTISFAGIELNEHIADGTFASFDPEGTYWTISRGGDGEKTRVRTYNNGGTFTLTLKQGSPVNKKLTIIMDADLASGRGIGVLLVTDPSGNSTLVGNQAFIAGAPSYARGVDEGDITWTILIGNAVVQELGLDAAGEYTP